MFCIMHYYLIIALQGYCIYHALKSKNDYYWIFIILFIPVIGSIIYLFTQAFNKRDLENVQSEIVAIINPTKKVLDLKKQLDFSETFQNKVSLADAFLEIKDYQNAITYYEDAIDSLFSGDVYVISNLIKAHFFNENYESVLKYIQVLKDKKATIKPENLLHYGLALDNLGKTELAENEFEKINISFSNYHERLILAKHLINKNKKDEAKEILQKVYEESTRFSRDIAKINRHTINNVKSLLKTL